MSWLIALSPEERLTHALDKTSRLIDHVSEVIRLHESNRLLVYSNILAAQIPLSYAAHAFNELSRAQHFFEIARLCALWDASDEHRDSIPTVFSLLNDGAVRVRLRQQVADSWGKDGTGFSELQASGVFAKLQRAERLCARLVVSSRLKAIRNFRYKFIAHALTLTNAEAKGAVIPNPKYGHEGRLVYASTAIIKALYLALKNADFAFEMTTNQAKRNASDFWRGLSFTAVPRS